MAIGGGHRGQQLKGRLQWTAADELSRGARLGRRRALRLAAAGQPLVLGQLPHLSVVDRAALLPFRHLAAQIEDRPRATEQGDGTALVR